MDLAQILAFTVFALLAGWVLPPRWRSWLILGASMMVVYWLQPATPIRNLGFWLATLSIGLTLWVWAITRDEENRQRTTLLTSAVIIGVILAIALTRYLGPLCCLTAARPPQLPLVLAALSIIAILFLLAFYLRSRKLTSWVAMLVILALFLTLKTGPLAYQASAALRKLAGQDVSLASAMELQWIGFSYLAFRLLHVLRDYQAGRLAKQSLREFAIYVFFFPAFLAGPIDRSDRFVQDLRSIPDNESSLALPVSTGKAATGKANLSIMNPGKHEKSLPFLVSWIPNKYFPAKGSRVSFFFNLPAEDLLQGGKRILFGIFKKFVFADNLALLALNGQNAGQIASAPWMWVALYAYALRIYFDFSGYTDIALGLGRLLGIRLPENFLSPYTKTNLTAFWNSWHITLAQWFRSYFFNPVTRALRSSPGQWPSWAIIFIGQFGVMLLIGLWHGVTWNFALWGLWHAAGLFIHNRWLDWRKRHSFAWEIRPAFKTLLSFSGWALTFHYVTLGWVWFAMPDLRQSWQALQTLSGGS